MINGIIMGVGYGMVLVGIIMTSKYAKQIRDFKLRLVGKKSE